MNLTHTIKSCCLICIFFHVAILNTEKSYALSIHELNSLQQQNNTLDINNNLFKDIDISSAHNYNLNSTNTLWKSDIEKEGVLLAQKGLYREALDKFRNALLSDPNQSSVYTKIGDILFQTGNKTESEIYYKSALQHDSSDRFAHQRLGIIEQGRGNYPAAIEHFKQGLLGTTENYLGVRVNLAQCYILTGQFQEAIAVLESRKNTPEFTTTARLVLASAYLGLHQNELALHEYEVLLKENPSSVQVLTSLGITYRIIGNYDNSIKYLNKALTQAPQDALILYQRGETFRAQGRTANAIRDYLAVSNGWMKNISDQRLAEYYKNESTKNIFEHEVSDISKSSSLPTTYIHIALLYISFNEADIAKNYLKSVTQKFQNDVKTLYEAGNIYAFIKDYQHAEYLFKSVLKISPSNIDAKKALIMAYMRQNKYTDAVEAAKNILEQKKIDDNDVLFVATIYQDASRNDLSIPLYENIIQKDPENVIALNNIASLLIKNDNRAQAVQYAEKAYKLATNSAAIQDTYGWALVQNGNLTEGLKLLSQCVDNNPLNPVYLFHYGAAQENLMKGSGIEYLKKSLQISQDFPESEQAKDILEKSVNQ